MQEDILDGVAERLFKMTNAEEFLRLVRSVASVCGASMSTWRLGFISSRFFPSLGVGKKNCQRHSQTYFLK